MKIEKTNWQENYDKNTGFIKNQDTWNNEEVFSYMAGCNSAADANAEKSASEILREIESLEASGKLTGTMDKNGDGKVSSSEIDSFCKNAGAGNSVSADVADKVKNATSNEAKNSVANSKNAEYVKNFSPSSTTKSSSLTSLNKALDAIADKDPKIAEIKSKITEKQGELTGFQEELAAINDGSDPEIAGLKEAEDKAYQEYQDKMNESSGTMDTLGGIFGGATPDKIDAKKNEVEQKQGEIDAKSSEIPNQESTVSNCQTEVTNAQSNVETCEASVSALEGQLSSAGDDEDAQSTLNFQLSLAKNALEQAIAEKENAEAELEKAESELEKLNSEKEKLEQEHADLEQELTELQDEFEEKHPEVAEAREAWETAKEATETRKQEKAGEVQQKIDKAQGELNSLEQELQEAQNEKTSQRFSANDVGDDIVNFAEGYLGLNEADGSADMFLEDTKASNTVNSPTAKYSSKSTHWCAAYVEYIMENNPSAGDVADWYQEIGNKWYCPTIYSAAVKSDAVIDGSGAQKGDIVLFDWQANGSAKDHIGIFAGIENGKAVVIEGNTGNAKVEKRTYELDDPRLTYCKMHS